MELIVVAVAHKDGPGRDLGQKVLHIEADEALADGGGHGGGELLTAVRIYGALDAAIDLLKYVVGVEVAALGDVGVVSVGVHQHRVVGGDPLDAVLTQAGHRLTEGVVSHAVSHPALAVDEGVQSRNRLDLLVPGRHGDAHGSAHAPSQQAAALGVDLRLDLHEGEGVGDVLHLGLQGGILGQAGMDILAGLETAVVKSHAHKAVGGQSTGVQGRIALVHAGPAGIAQHGSPFFSLLVIVGQIDGTGHLGTFAVEYDVSGFHFKLPPKK